MKKYYPFIVLALAAAVVAATLVAGSRIRDYWYVGSAGMDDTDRMIFERTNAVPNTNVTINWLDLKTAVTNIATNAVMGSGVSLHGSTNFINLSVQAAKLPTTNYPGIDAGWQDWELLYYKTNAEGSIASLNSSWQFIMPADYATNRMLVRIFSLLETTNGPNSSNTIFRASVLRAQPGDSTDWHVGAYGSSVSGTNTWAASGTVTNQIKSVVINMTNVCLVAPGDLCILKVDRDAANDTYGGVTAVVGIQVEYVRP